jgi:O-antigen ligase
MCLPFAVMYPVAVLSRTRLRHVSPAAPAWKACGLLSIAALILVAILHSLSRMGFLAALSSLLAIGCIALGAKRQGWKRWLPVALLSVLALLAFILLPDDPLIARYAQLVPADAISSDMRTGMWRDTLGLIKAFPLFGCGLGAYESCFPRYQTVAPMNTIDFAHNDYLQYLSELGALAFLAGLMFVLRVFRQANPCRNGKAVDGSPLCRPGVHRLIRGDLPTQFRGLQSIYSVERHALGLDCRNRGNFSPLWLEQSVQPPRGREQTAT